MKSQQNVIYIGRNNQVLPIPDLSSASLSGKTVKLEQSFNTAKHVTIVQAQRQHFNQREAQLRCGHFSSLRVAARRTSTDCDSCGASGMSKTELE